MNRHACERLTPETGYVICIHVEVGAPIFCHHKPPAGGLLCRDCVDRDIRHELDADLLLYVCPKCAEKFLTKSIEAFGRPPLERDWATGETRCDL